MAENYNDRVDATILIGALRLSRLNQSSLRGAIEGHRAACVQNQTDSLNGEWADWWGHRADRCWAVLEEPNDSVLRKRARDALIREGR